MPIAGTKAELLQAMEEEHRGLKECLNGLDAVAAGERGVCGEWSAKDEWPLARWIAANTSSHYRWARTRIRRWANSRARGAATL